MLLRLKRRPDPTNAALFADEIVEATLEITDETLDFSVESLEKVDAILQSFIDDGVPADNIKETLFGFGCYVGEVFVRNAGASWRELAADDKLVDAFGWPLVVSVPNGKICNPIGKVFKRVEQGESENLPFFYVVFTEPTAKS